MACVREQSVQKGKVLCNAHNELAQTIPEKTYCFITGSGVSQKE
jgi:hypothetical protein